MNKEEKELLKEGKIRHYFDEKSGEIYFSVVDVIENLGLSKDSRNYWKVLKNRLKKTNNQLVTACNQSKMLSRDGKYYQTDVAIADILLQIIQIIFPEKVKEFGEYFNYLNNKLKKEIGESSSLNNELSTFSEEGEIGIDMFKDNNSLVVRAMIAGMNPENILISINYDKLIIRGNRLKLGEDIKEDDYSTQELFWGKFSRVIDLPQEVDIDRVEATFNHGLLEVKLSILDKDRIKIIKIKNSDN